MRTLLKGILVAAAFVAGTVVAAEAFERRGDDVFLVVAGRQAVPNMDPSLKYDASRRTFFQAMYDALFKYEGTPPEAKPWLAESYSVSDDGLTYTFNLAKDAKFHNGDPVTAEAVRWSFERTLKLGQGPSWSLAPVLKPENIKVVDDHTVEMTLERPFSPFLSFLPWWYVLNPAEVMANEVDGDYGQAYLVDNSAGGGPYKIARVEPNNLYELERYDDYWKGHEGDLSGIIYKVVREGSVQRAGLQKGEFDIVLDLSPDEFQVASRTRGVETSTEPALTSFGIKFNTQAEFTDDVNIRKAIAHAFDYDALVKIFNGRAQLQTSPFTDNIRGHVEVDGIPRQDLAKAKEFLAQSSHPDGGFELEFVYVQGFEAQRQMGLVLIDSLKDLGIDVKMVPLTWANMVERMGSEETAPQMICIFTTPISNDPDAVAIQYHPISHGQYYGSHYLDDPDLNAMIEEARAAIDWDEREPIYAQIQEKIVELQPEMFGMMRERLVAYRDYVQGFEYTPVRMTSEIDMYGLHIGQ
ncbi:MAG: ABC transporter substrate-binding protein [Pseudomonadota bacterium]